MIAAALIGSPDLLIADEPTTALDVTTQAAVLAIINAVVEARGMGLILITHDLGVVAELCRDVDGNVQRPPDPDGTRLRHCRAGPPIHPRTAPGAGRGQACAERACPTIADMLPVGWGRCLNSAISPKTYQKRGPFGRILAEVKAVRDISLVLAPGKDDRCDRRKRIRQIHPCADSAAYNRTG